MKREKKRTNVKGRWAYFEFLIIARQKIRGERAETSRSRGPYSGSYVHDPLLAPISYCTHVYVYNMYIQPPSIRLVAIAAFQTRRGIDVPDASKVGERKKKGKKGEEEGGEMWGSVALSVKYTQYVQKRKPSP